MSSSVILVTALLLGSAGYLGLAGYVWLRHRNVTGALPLVAMLLAVGLWTIFYALELTSRDIPTARVWSGLKFVGVVALPPALWAFVMQYTGRGRMFRRVLWILAIEPAIVLGVLAIPATYNLLHYYPPPGELERIGGSPIPKAGPLFWPHAVYTYVLMLGATAALSVSLVRVARPYRRPAYAMIVVSVLPFLANVAYNLGALGTIPDPTPFLFTLTAAVLVWGLLRLRLLDLMPVARGAVVEQMAEGVLVLDAYGRIVDANPAGARLLALTRAQLVGRQLADLLPSLAAMIFRHRPGTPTRSDSQVRLGPPGLPGESDLAVSVSGLTDAGGRQTGHLVVLRDITELKRTERRMRELLQEQTHLSQTLTASLRPSSMPQVPGLRLVARSIPAGLGAPPGRTTLGGSAAGVSGDFYDVHPAGRCRWAFVVGDVSGKGVHAAVVTSMARYTVRTLSAQPWPPRDVLGQLNQALLVGDDDERFCTVAYGQVTYPGMSLREPESLDRQDAPVTGPVRITLALGGHPQPLLRRRDGTVCPVGQPGTALGLIHDIDVQDVTIDLEAGDVLLTFTDGVTEARRDREQFGEDRLASVLADAASGLPLEDAAEVGPVLAAKLADAVADRVIAAVEGFSVDRDDVAVLVLAAC
jgi:PAS domain S-box-containing protein